MRRRAGVLAAGLCVLAAGCVSAGRYDALASGADFAQGKAALRGAPSTVAGSVESTRKLIWTASLTVEVQEIAGPAQAATDIAKEAGGYVQSRSDSEENYANLTLRVPAAALKDVVGKLEALGKVTYRSMSSRDVTEEYIDLEARLANMIALRDRLKKLLDKATDVKEILAIEKELSRAQAEIDSMTGRMKALKGQVDLATLELTLDRKEILGPLGAAFKAIGWGIEKLFVIRE